MTVLASAGCGSRQSGGPSPSVSSVVAIQGQLARIAAQANQAAPAAVDPDTRLDGAQAGPGLKLTTRYTLVNAAANGIDPASFGTKLVPVVTKGSCANPELRPLIDQGVVVVLEYRDLEGKPLGTARIDRATCQAPG